MNLRYGLIIAVLVIIAGCKKNNGNSFTIDNQSNAKAMNVAVYSSASDYINGTNSIASGTAPANGTFTFPASKLTKGGTYYVDVYSSDYLYTNWTNDNTPFIGDANTTPKQFTYTGQNRYGIVYLTVNMTNARVSLLNSTNASTHWKAVDALDLVDGSSIWYSLPASQRFAGITVSKNSTGTYSYLDGKDTVITSFSFGDIVGYPVYIVLPNETYLHFFITNTSVNPAIGSYEPPTITSVVSLINGNLYLLARQ